MFFLAKTKACNIYFSTELGYNLHHKLKIVYMLHSCKANKHYKKTSSGVRSPLLLSPLTENLRPSLVTHIVTDSPKLLRFWQTRANSAEGIFIIALYSVSGIPTCSLSISISFMANSDILKQYINPCCWQRSCYYSLILNIHSSWDLEISFSEAMLLFIHKVGLRSKICRDCRNYDSKSTIYYKYKYIQWTGPKVGGIQRRQLIPNV